MTVLILILTGLLIGLKYDNITEAQEWMLNMKMIMKDMIEVRIKQLMLDIKPCLNKENLNYSEELLFEIISLTPEQILYNILHNSSNLLMDMISMIKNIEQ